jgi:hypothetical protein
MSVCAVSAPALLASSARPALAEFCATLLSNQPLILQFAATSWPPTGVVAGITIFEIGADRIRDVISVSLDVYRVRGHGPRRGRAAGCARVPDETVFEDTRYVLDVR